MFQDAAASEQVEGVDGGLGGPQRLEVVRVEALRRRRKVRKSVEILSVVTMMLFAFDQRPRNDFFSQ